MSLFDYSQDFKSIDFRHHPELYRIGKGEQGVLLVEPYKREILPRWKLKTVAEDPEKTAAAAISYERYVTARRHPMYVRLKKQHQEKFESQTG